MLSFVVVGSGYRAQFYGRIAKKHPELFRAMFLCRSQAKVDFMQEMGMQATTSLAACEQFQPDFIVVAATKKDLGEIAAVWADKGYPVAMETPAGISLAQLEALHALHEKSARITVFEQYHRYPILAAGLHELTLGRIGNPSSAYISLAHEYHAASLLRRMLDTLGEGYSMIGTRSKNTVVETDSRYGRILDGRTSVRQRDVVTICYESGKMALYDFSGLQYHSLIRSRHLIVRGDKGEWNDDHIVFLDENNNPVHKKLVPLQHPVLEVPDLLETGLTLDNDQDEYAIATMLLDMGEFIDTGKEPYPLGEALDDAYFAVFMKEALECPGKTIASKKMPW